MECGDINRALLSRNHEVRRRKPGRKPCLVIRVNIHAFSCISFIMVAISIQVLGILVSGMKITIKKTSVPEQKARSHALSTFFPRESVGSPGINV